MSTPAFDLRRMYSDKELSWFDHKLKSQGHWKNQKAMPSQGAHNMSQKNVQGFTP